MSIATRNEVGELEMIWTSRADGSLRMLWFDRDLRKTQVGGSLLTAEQHIRGWRRGR